MLRADGYEFEVIAPPVEEVSHPFFTIREITAANATGKALATARRIPGGVVLGADTLVTIDGDVIGKPANLNQARRILRRLVGRSHEVWTAVFICRAQPQQGKLFHEVSRVSFREFDGEAIERYLARVNPLDKAGAYAAQGDGAEIIARIEGSLSNVIGLPMEATKRALATFGIHPTGPQRTSSGSRSAG